MLHEYKMSTAEKAESDGYTLINGQRTKLEVAEIRKDKKRFTAAIKWIKADNKRRKEVETKEIAARRKAVEQ